MSGKKNNVRNKVLIVTAFIAVASFLFLANDQLDSKIAKHEKIVAMETTQKHIEEKVDTVISKQEVLNNKMDWMILELSKLLRDEYGP